MMAQSSFKSLRNALSICRAKKLSWKQTSTAAFSLLPSATRERSTSSCRATRGCRAHAAQMINVELFVIGLEYHYTQIETLYIALAVQETSVSLWTVNDESFFSPVMLEYSSTNKAERERAEGPHEEHNKEEGSIS